MTTMNHELRYLIRRLFKLEDDSSTIISFHSANYYEELQRNNGRWFIWSLVNSVEWWIFCGPLVIMIYLGKGYRYRDKHSRMRRWLWKRKDHPNADGYWDFIP